VPDANVPVVEGLWRNLRQRKVAQWGIAYVAGAWACLQVFDYVRESFGWPDQLRQVGLFAALGGLPIALIVAWFHGAQGRQRVTGLEISVIALLAATGVLFSVAATSAWMLVRNRAAGQIDFTDRRVEPLTDFDGLEQSAAVSRDGRLAAFLSNRDGPWDVWITRIGTGEFQNLTRGLAGDIVLDDIRNLRFSPDGSLVTLWRRTMDPASGATKIDVWAIPAAGGELRPFLSGAVELDWSRDGTRIAYHTTAPGDPIFVTDSGEMVGRQVHVAPPATHCHFPTWSPDDEFIYFARGAPPDAMDLWRVQVDGTNPERLTFHESRVSHPTFIDERNLAYLATDRDGSGPWLHVLDTHRRESRRLGIGADRYTSLAASQDGRHLVATAARPKSSLWRAPLSDDTGEWAAASRISVQTTGGRSPRHGPDYLLYVASRGDQDVIWKLAQGSESASELWTLPASRVLGGPAIAADGRHIAFTVERDGQARLMLMSSDGADVRSLGGSLAAQGTPAWSPTGRALGVAALREGVPRLHRVSVDGTAPAPLVGEYSTDPAWAPSGDFLVYATGQIGPTIEVRAVDVDGRPRKVPRLVLGRSARRTVFMPGSTALTVMRGDGGDVDFWRIDLETGQEQRLTDLGREFFIHDFDVSPDGREIVFDRQVSDADIVLIERE
jgi:Tol biopolymer transport system component